MTEYKKSLPQLFFPIFFENFFAMLTGMVDTLMLSMEGDQAVGAVGTANTYISIFVIMFSIISSGMIAVMTQYIGARRPGVAQRAMRLGLLFNLAVGIVISGVLFCFAGSILGAIGIARTFAYGGSHHRAIYDPELPPRTAMNQAQYYSSNSTSLNHFYEKLFLLEDMMNTETGKAIARKRTQYMQEFVDEFLHEWDGLDK